MSWLLSPTSLFSRSASSSSVPTLLLPKRSRSAEKSEGDEDAPSTPFEQEYGVPDLPGGWPGWDLKSKLDEATPRQKLDVVVQENGHVKVISAELAASTSKSINSKVEVGVGGKERSSEGESGWERDIWVTKLVVHPIKSCRGIPVRSSVLTPQGLQYDRQWAIRNRATGQLVTAREQPRLVLIHCSFDEKSNELRVSFPSDSGLEGFVVGLRTGLEEMGSWERIPSSSMHGHTLPPALIPPALHSPSKSPSEQISRFLGIDVQLVQVSPFKTDERVCDPPPGVGEKAEWEEQAQVDKAKGEVVTGFADGYPLLIANEASYRAVASSIQDSASDEPPSALTNLGPKFDKARWREQSFDFHRFRANIIVGSRQDLPLEMQDPLVENKNTRSESMSSEHSAPPAAWEEDTWRKLEFTDNSGSSTRNGTLICTSRCGRCQLPNVCPETAEPDKVVPFKIISKYRRVDPAQKYTPIFGVNSMSGDRSGSLEIRVGDRVRVVARNSWGSLPVSNGYKSGA